MDHLLRYVDRTDLTGVQVALAWVVGIAAGIGVAALLLFLLV